MKKLFSLLTILLLSITLAACGNNDEVTNPPQNDTTTEEPNDGATEGDPGDDNHTDDQTDNNNQANGDSNNTDLTSDYAFTSFDLEVDIENNDDAVDVDYDVDDDDKDIEASYENKPENINLRGNEAMDELNSIFTSFQFDENTPDEEVINEVLQAFNIPEDAAKIDLEIEFDGNVEKEYRR